MRTLTTTIGCWLAFLPSLAQDLEDLWIDWSPDLVLEWKDFQGGVPSSAFKAETHWRIYYDYQLSVINQEPRLANYSVITQFSTRDSWVKNQGGSDQLLIHERGHFDLAEICARRFRSQLDTLRFHTDDYQSEIDSLFDQNLSECDVMQNRYDQETAHGLQPEKQSEWLSFFEQELNNLEQYSYSD